MLAIWVCDICGERQYTVDGIVRHTTMHDEQIELLTPRDTYRRNTRKRAGPPQVLS